MSFTHSISPSMNKFLAVFLISTLSLLKVAAQTTNSIIQEINEVMLQQETDWNKGDIEAYMLGYWKSDSLLFLGGKGPVYGWEKTLSNYQKTYASKNQMGKLKFENIKIEVLSDTNAFVIGKWHLERKETNLGGWYSLLWKKIDKEWKIVIDHSSSL